MGDEASIGDVVKGKKRGRCADNKQLLYGKDNNAVWAELGHESESEAQFLD